MLLTLDCILEGRHQIIEEYQQALSKWKEIMRQDESQNVDSLSRIINVKQFWFENNCSLGRECGQEIMVVSGMAQFYRKATGFGNSLSKALLVYNAIKKSDCSLSVKNCADSMAKQLGLI